MSQCTTLLRNSLSLNLAHFFETPDICILGSVRKNVDNVHVYGLLL